MISARGKHEAQTEFSLQTLHKRLEQGLPEGTILGEPSPAALAKAHGHHRFQLMLRSEKIRPLCAHIRRVVESLTLPPDVLILWDVDPMNLG